MRMDALSLRRAEGFGSFGSRINMEDKVWRRVGEGGEARADCI